MNIDQYIIVLEGYVIPDNDDIATEGINIKEKFRKIFDAVKAFFREVYIKIRNFIASEIFKSTMVNKDYFNDFFNNMKKDSSLYKVMVNESMKEIKEVLNSHLNGRLFSELSEDEKSKIKEDILKIDSVHSGEIDRYRKGGITPSAIKFSTDDTILYYKNDNLIPLSKGKLDELTGYIRVFESEAEKFGNFVRTLNIPDNDFDVVFVAYSNIAKTGMKYTSQYMQYLNKILVKPKSKYDIKDLGGTFTVTPDI